MINKESEVEVIKCILDEIGISINEDGTLIDQETKNLIYCQEKKIKYSFDDKPIYIGVDDVLFDPIHDTRTMTALFVYYLNKEELLGNLIPPVIYYPEESDDKEFSRVYVKTRDSLVCSGWFKNKSLKFMHLIVVMSGIPCFVDLSEFEGE